LPSPPPTPPVPLLAGVFAGPLTCQVTFDQALVPGPIQSSNWSIRYNNLMYTVLGANVVGSIAHLPMIAGAPGFGANYVTYTAALAPRLVGLVGLLDAAPFVQFPF